MKHSLRLLLLGIAVLLCAGLYILVPHTDERPAPTPTPTAIPVFSVSPEQITGLSWDYAARTLSFALRFLRTDSSANGRKRRCARNHFVRLLKLPLYGKCNKFGNIYVNGASGHTGLIFAIQTAFRLVYCSFFGITKRNLFKVFIPYKRRLRRHRIFIGTHIEL